MSIIHSVHASGLACRCISPERVLLTGPDWERVEVSGSGLADVLEYDSRKSLLELQQEDVVALVRVMLSLMMRQDLARAGRLLMPPTGGRDIQIVNFFFDIQNFSITLSQQYFFDIQKFSTIQILIYSAIHSQSSAMYIQIFRNIYSYSNI